MTHELEIERVNNIDDKHVLNQINPELLEELGEQIESGYDCALDLSSLV